MSLLGLINKELSKRNLLPSNWAEFAPMTNIRSGGGVVPFKAYDFQVDLIQTIERSPSTIILKSRQTGVSETVTNWILKRALIEQGFNAAIFSKTQADSSNLCARIRDSAMSLGRLCPPFLAESKTHLQFEGGGQMYFLPSTARASRGLPSVSCIFLDEAAFIDNINGLFQAVIPTMAMLGDRGRVILASTPNGKGNLFYQLWKTNTPDWAKVKIHYSQHPVYAADPDWATKTRESRNLTMQQFQQEFELNFAESEATVFNESLIDTAIADTFAAPQWMHQYLVGIDPSFGGDDFYTVRVWDVTSFPYQLAAQFKDNRKSKDYYIEKTIDCIEPYAPSLIAVETNSGGALYQQELIKERPEWLVEGVNMNNASKILHTDRLVLLLERQQLQAPAESLEEYKHFIESIDGSTRKREAESGHHDDSVMADAVAFAKLEDMPPLPDYTASTADDRPVYDVLSSLGM